MNEEMIESGVTKRKAKRYWMVQYLRHVRSRCCYMVKELFIIPRRARRSVKIRVYASGLPCKINVQKNKTTKRETCSSLCKVGPCAALTVRCMCDAIIVDGAHHPCSSARNWRCESSALCSTELTPYAPRHDYRQTRHKRAFSAYRQSEPISLMFISRCRCQTRLRPLVCRPAPAQRPLPGTLRKQHL